jgi:hypothetical protein
MASFWMQHDISAHALALPSWKDWIAAGMTNDPYDYHPSAKGQAFLSDLMLPIIDRALGDPAR